MNDSRTGEDAALAAALEKYMTAFEAGEAPPADVFLADYPAIRERLKICIDALQVLEVTHRGEAGSPAGLGSDHRIGDFRIVREIGRGGMGIVFEAEQMSLGRKVALKVLPFLGALDPKQIQRFKNEAQAAAQLQHEHIVSVYSVGSDQGVYFYAMPLIDGSTLADFVARLDPAVRDSLEVFRVVARLGLQAAEALEHAHEHGVVHRDIKPSNLLVDRDEKLWIADFGLARIATEASLTLSGDLVGTLKYMSPEQALGKRELVDSRTDIYSMGASLYEVITGQAAVQGSDQEEVLRRLAFEEPVPLRKARRDVPRDLETIVLKALSKEPATRYQSAKDLAADLRRFLNGLPIVARPASAVERSAKWVRRHRAIAVLLGTFALVAAVGLAVTTVVVWREQGKTRRALEKAEKSLAEAKLQGERAERNIARAREAVRKMLARVGAERLADVPQMESVRRELLEDALELYKGLSEDTHDHPMIRLETAQTCLSMQGVLWMLGRTRDAAGAARKAVRICEELLKDPARSVDPRKVLWQASAELGETCNSLGERVEAIASLRRALQVLRELSRELPEDPSFPYQTAVCRQLLAMTLEAAGETHEAKKELGSALETLEGIVPRLAARSEHGEGLADTFWKLGTLAESLSDAGEAIRAFERAREVSLNLPEATRGSVSCRSRLSEIYNGLGNLLSGAGRPAESETAYREGIKISRGLVSSFPASAMQVQSLTTRLINLGTLLLFTNRKAEAREAYLEALKSPGDHLKSILMFPMVQQSFATAVGNLAFIASEGKAARGVSEELKALLPILAGLSAGSAASRDAIQRLVDGLLDFLPRAADQVPQEQIEGLKNCVARLAQLFPKDPAIRSRAGQAFARLGAFEPAILNLEAATELGEEASEVQGLLSGCRKAIYPVLISASSVDAELERPEVLFGQGELWRLWRGRAEPSRGLEWTSLDFDDAAWESAPGGFGYGEPGLGTVLEDMQGAYTTAYVRRRIEWTGPAGPAPLLLAIQADDGFVAYWNGEELGRGNAGDRDTRLPFDAVAPSVAREPITEGVLEVPSRLLKTGSNVIAIQGLNQSKTSSDFTLLASLRRAPRPGAETGRRRFEAFVAQAGDRAQPELKRYFEARLLQQAGQNAEAARVLRELVSLPGSGAKPYLRLAQCLASSGDSAGSERTLRQALSSGVESLELWSDWLVLAGLGAARDPPWYLKAMPPSLAAEPESRWRAELAWALEELAKRGALRLNCGGVEYVSRSGVVWSADRCHIGGQRYFEQRGGDYLFEGTVSGTDDPLLYRSERWFPPGQGPAYRIFLPPGRYRVVLHFAEIRYEKPGIRVFDIILEGKMALAAFDPCEAGYAKAQAKTFEVDVTGGRLEMELRHLRENPKLSALEVVPLRP